MRTSLPVLARPALPRPLARRFDALQRDLRALVGGFVGPRAPVVSPRDGRGWLRRIPRAEAQRRVLVVQGIDRLTKSAVQIRLADESGAQISFHPGQFLTLCVTIDGVEHRRAYSLCSDPTRPGEVAVGVKKAGLVSGFLVDTLAVGATLGALGPSGSYGVQLDAQARRTVVLVAGGSGITPQLAIARGVLRVEPQSRVVLLYANRSVDEIMFAAQLDDLQREFPERLVIRHVLEQAPEGFVGGVGRLGATELDRCPQDAEWFVCGPTGMTEAVVGLLAERGITRVHIERFTPPPRAQTASLEPQPLLINLGGTRIATTVAPGQTLLEAGLAGGAALPYSCTLGGCGACRVKRVAGQVVLDAPNCLTERERAEGDILACVARPIGPVEIEVPRW